MPEMTEKRLAALKAHQFKKGESGNRAGRPFSFAKKIRKRTRGGIELIEFALEVLRGTATAAAYSMFGEEYQRKPSMKERLVALEFLADRLGGKPFQATAVELSGPEGRPLEVESQVVNDRERLATVVSILERARALPAGLGGGEALKPAASDVEPVDSTPADTAPGGGPPRSEP